MTDPTPSSSAHPEVQPTPKRLRLHTAWLIVSWALVFALIYGSLANIHLPVHPQEELLKILIDKGKHFAAYFLLMFLFANIYYFNNRRQLAYLAFLSLLGYGLEYGQGLTITGVLITAILMPTSGELRWPLLSA